MKQCSVDARSWDHPSYPEKTIAAAASPAERRVVARRGWAGENDGLFEHPAWAPVAARDTCVPSSHKELAGDFQHLPTRLG